MFTYGRRTNQHLLLHYSFCYEDNMYDFKDLTLNMEPASKEPKDCINIGLDAENVQSVYMKVDQFNHTLMSYLRHIRKSQFGSIPLIGRPLALKFEKVCMEGYLEMMTYHVSEHLEKETTLEDDLSMLKDLTLEQGFNYNMRFATIYRSERKKIIHN